MIALSLGCTASPGVVVADDIPDGSPVLGPGCIGMQDESCSPYPEGTQCPGDPEVCVSCGKSIYAASQSLCVCTSGNWACAPPKPAEISCSSAVGNYTDPSCSVPYAADAGTDAARDSGDKG
jgi:hypothetical protein